MTRLPIEVFLLTLFSFLPGSHTSSYESIPTVIPPSISSAVRASIAFSSLGENFNNTYSCSSTQVLYQAESANSITTPCFTSLSPHKSLTARKVRQTSQYIRPTYDPSAACNIYGPIEQVGSIVIGVNLTDKTTSTTLACSNYLEYLSHENRGCPDTLYQSEFGRSPECTSFAEQKLHYRPAASNNSLTSSVDDNGYCDPPCLHIERGIPMFFEGSRVMEEEDLDYTCCGNCKIIAEEVNLLYWPSTSISVNSRCARASITSEPNLPHSTEILKERDIALFGNISTKVVDGFTFTSPSLYLVFSGTVSVNDSCGQRGLVRTNPTIALNSNYLLTAEYPNWKSLCPEPQWKATLNPLSSATIGTFHQSDFACPTWGLSDPFLTTCDDSVFLTKTVGPPFNPIIVVATEILSLDPEWASCTKIEDSIDPLNPFLFTYGVYDPPRMLVPASALTPPDSIKTTPLVSLKPTAAPKSVVSPNLPDPTIKLINSARVSIESGTTMADKPQVLGPSTYARSDKNNGIPTGLHKDPHIDSRMKSYSVSHSEPHPDPLSGPHPDLRSDPHTDTRPESHTDPYSVEITDTHRTSISATAALTSEPVPFRKMSFSQDYEKTLSRHNSPVSNTLKGPDGAGSSLGIDIDSQIHEIHDPSTTISTIETTLATYDDGNSVQKYFTSKLAVWSVVKQPNKSDSVLDSTDSQVPQQSDLIPTSNGVHDVLAPSAITNPRHAFCAHNSPLPSRTQKINAADPSSKPSKPSIDNQALEKSTLALTSTGTAVTPAPSSVEPIVPIFSSEKDMKTHSSVENRPFDNLPSLLSPILEETPTSSTSGRLTRTVSVAPEAAAHEVIDSGSPSQTRMPSYRAPSSSANPAHVSASSAATGETRDSITASQPNSTSSVFGNETRMQTGTRGLARGKGMTPAGNASASTSGVGNSSRPEGGQGKGAMETDSGTAGAEQRLGGGTGGSGARRRVRVSWGMVVLVAGVGAVGWS